MNILVKCGKYGEFYFDEETGLVISHEYLHDSFGYPPISVILSDLDGHHMEYDIDNITYLNNQGHSHHCKIKAFKEGVSNSIVRGLGIEFTFNPYSGAVIGITKTSEYGPTPTKVDIRSLQRRTLEMDIPIALINGLLPEYELKDVAY